MATVPITIQVDENAAKAFVAATVEQRRKMELILSLRLQDVTTGPPRPLRAVMDSLGTAAKARGLAPEVLESLLHDP
jgi:ferritin-like protein